MPSAGFPEAGKQQTQGRCSSKVAEGQDCPSWLIHKASFKVRWRPGKCLCLGDWSFCEGQSPAASGGSSGSSLGSAEYPTCGLFSLPAEPTQGEGVAISPEGILDEKCTEP